MSLELFKKSILRSTIQKRDGYSYIVNPITDGIPQIDPKILIEVVNEMEKNIEKFKPFDKFVTIEAMGIPITSVLSYILNIPFTIIRKRKYSFLDEIEIDQKTGYSNSKLYINNISSEDKIVIIDDIISTGATLDSILYKFKKNKIKTQGVIVIIDKGKAIDYLKKKYDIKIISLLNIDISINKIIIRNS